MASPPPPYANITGITRTVMKDNAQESLVNYDGNARPGELVMNLLTDPPTVYIGNNLGQLTELTFGGSGNGVPAGPVNSIQFNAGNNFFGGTANVVVSGTGISVVGNVYGNYGVFSGGNTVINSVISTTGNIIGGNISTAGNIYANNIVGNTTFNGGYYGAFHTNYETTLAGGINSNSVLPIAVVSTAGWPTSGALLIDQEIISYTGISGNTFTGITRHVSGSTGATHANASPVSFAQIAAANTATTLVLDQTDYSNGITVNSSHEITVANAGLYNCQFSVQTICADNVPDDIAVWFAVDGVNVPSSASYVTTQQVHAGHNGAAIMTVNIFYQFTAGQKLTLKWVTLAGTSAITSYASVSSPAIPTSPSVIFTINQIA